MIFKTLRDHSKQCRSDNSEQLKHTKMASCTEVDEKVLEEYYLNLQELQQTGHIPLDIKKKVRYKVY